MGENFSDSQEIECYNLNSNSCNKVHSNFKSSFYETKSIDLDFYRLLKSYYNKINLNI